MERGTTHARVAGLPVLLMLAGALLAPPRVSAFQEDVHYDATFAVALAVGWSWDDALVIASSDQGIDENVDTEPSITVVQTPKNDPQPNPGLRNQALAIVLGLRTRVPMQDYLFHCFSRSGDAKGSRNPDVLDRLKALDDEAARAIDLARQRPTKGNDVRALIAIGIYLHCLQDSWSHSGYGAEPLGHVKDGTDPDNPAKNADMARRALGDTRERLGTFLQRRSGRPPRSPGHAHDVLVDGYTSRIAMALDDAARVRCNRRLVEHWLYTVLSAEGRLADAGVAARVRSRETLLRLVKMPKSEVEKPNAARPQPLSSPFSEPDTCDMVFVDTFPEVLQNMPPQETPTQLCTVWPCDTVMIDDVELPAPKYPQLRVMPTLADPVYDEATGRYRVRP